MENCYKILGVSQTASSAEIKRAYRKKIMELHPDRSKTSDTVKEFTKVVRAYEILSDVRSRSIFDSSLFAHFHAQRAKKSSFDYRTWLLERNDDESRAKLIFFDLMHSREDDAVREFKEMQTSRAGFTLKAWFTREDFMDYGFILAEELVLRQEYYDAVLLLEQIIRMEYSYSYFRHFFPEVIAFMKSILHGHIDGVLSDELALDVWERALELELGAKEDSFLLQKMAVAYKRLGDVHTAEICLQEAARMVSK